MAEKNVLANLLDTFAKNRPPTNGQGSKSNGLSGELPMADEQSIAPESIVWVWSLEGFIVRATYYKQHSGHFMPGEFTIELYRESYSLLTAEQSKSLAEVLLSAARWRDTWQINAGAYLANDGKLQASPQSSDDAEEGRHEGGKHEESNPSQTVYQEPVRFEETGDQPTQSD